MKKGLKKLVILAMAGVMTIASVMTASAVGTVSAEEALKERFCESFTISDEHLYILFDNGYESYIRQRPQDIMGGWAGLSQAEKESVAYICALVNEDTHIFLEYGFEVFDRDAYVNAGADAAELDALIAKVTGHGETAVPVTTTAPTWKQDSVGWWVERPDGSYLVNEWYESNGLWYYMGADGYMLTNTTTPDGYTVNADGVWVK